MQANSPTDASEKIQSLDDVYYFGGQSVNDVQAVYPYTAKKDDEISMKPGDRLKISGNHWDGYSKATSRKTNQVGMFPSYLVEKYVHVVDFPDYSDFDRELAWATEMSVWPPERFWNIVSRYFAYLAQNICQLYVSQVCQ